MSHVTYSFTHMFSSWQSTPLPPSRSRPKPFTSSSHHHSPHESSQLSHTISLCIPCVVNLHFAQKTPCCESPFRRRATWSHPLLLSLNIQITGIASSNFYWYIYTVFLFNFLIFISSSHGHTATNFDYFSIVNNTY